MYEMRLHGRGGQGTVLAATELMRPSAGWSTPHRLALIELAEGVRVLAQVEGQLPAIEGYAAVRWEGERYRAKVAPGPPALG